MVGPVSFFARPPLPPRLPRCCAAPPNTFSCLACRSHAQAACCVASRCLVHRFRESGLARWQTGGVCGGVAGGIVLPPAVRSYERFSCGRVASPPLPCLAWLAFRLVAVTGRGPRYRRACLFSVFFATVVFLSPPCAAFPCLVAGRLPAVAAANRGFVAAVRRHERSSSWRGGPAVCRSGCRGEPRSRLCRSFASAFCCVGRP